jgi:dTMP kinase
VVEDRAEAGSVNAADQRLGPGVFVVFEGGDGVGKTTQATRLCDWLAATGYDFVRTYEPGDTAAGRRIRDIVLSPKTGDLAARAEALLYAADKAQHIAEVVRPALERGAVVVCDRYVDSMLAYQGAGRVLKLSEVESMARWATYDVRAHLTVVLDMDPALAVGEKREQDRVESAGDDFHARARSFFLDLAARDPDRYLVLDARQRREAITGQILERLRPLLKDVPVRPAEDELSEAPGNVSP